jgi:hypothetical protein
MEHLADDDVPELEDFSEEFKKIRKNQNNLAEKCSEIPINVIEDSKVEKVNKIIKSDQTQNKSEKTIKKEEEFGSGLFKKGLFIEKSEVHWVREDLALNNGQTLEVMARIRYRQPLQKATLHQFETGMYILFEEPQSAITEGQFVAWYLDDELVCSGVIS